MNLNKNNKTKLKKIFSNLFNEYAWSVTRSEYNVLRINFGNPYLKIRDRLNQKNSNDQVLIDATERRLVKPRGEWHLFVFFGDWVVITKSYTAKRNDSDLKNDDKAIDQLDGQKLLSVDYTPKQICRFEFDLGNIGDSSASGHKRR